MIEKQFLGGGGDKIQDEKNPKVKSKIYFIRDPF
jgi:hypothetical protein